MKRAALLAVLMAACRTPSSIAPDRADICWRLVERLPADPAGDALVAQVPILVLEPEPPEILTRILKEQAGVGEAAEMEVRVAGSRGTVRIRLKPSRPGVRVLGPDVIEVGEGRPAIVRFTSDSPGRASLEPQVDWASVLPGPPRR